MDLFPLYNSIRISLLSTFIIFIVCLFVANIITYKNNFIKSIFDVIFTLPLVLPPTVVGFLILKVLGPKRAVGEFFLNHFDVRLTMNWWTAIFSTSIVIFPLMYRTMRSSFEAYDYTYSEISKDLGANSIETFFLVKLPNCKEGLIAGAVLSFARALGEYGATSMVCGYTPGKTATIATTVYQLWRTNNDKEAFMWVMINIIISFVVLLFLNFFERNNKTGSLAHPYKTKTS